MANDITGSCEIGASVELVPDAVDDILPPGYLNEGTLPLDTSVIDIGVDPAGGMAITGECAECPEGFEWGCCEIQIPTEYPPGIPNLTSCETFVTGQVYHIELMKEINGRLWYGAENLMRIINFDGTVHKTIHEPNLGINPDTGAEWIPQGTVNFGEHFVQFGDKVAVMQMHVHQVGDVTDPNHYYGAIPIYDLDGNYLEYFLMPMFFRKDGIDSNILNKFDYCGDIESDGSMLICTTFGRCTNSTGAYEHGVWFWDYYGTVVKEIRFQYSDYEDVIDGVLAVNGKYWINNYGSTRFRIFEPNMLSSVDVNAPCTVAERYGHRIKVLDNTDKGDTLVAVTSKSTSTRDNCEYAAVMLYDTSGTYLRTIRPPDPKSYEVAAYHSKFGAEAGLARWGDYLIIGASGYGDNLLESAGLAAGKVYIYHIDGTFINEVGYSTLPFNDTKHNLGDAVWMTKDKAYMFSAAGVNVTDYVKICDITWGESTVEGIQ